MTSNSTDEKFNLVFRGELVKGVDAAVAKRNIGQLFKIDAAKVEAMFSGKPIVLKRGLTADAANKYRVAIKKAGALVALVMEQPERPRGRAIFGVPGDEVPASRAGLAAEETPGAIPGTEPSVGAIPGTSQAEEPVQGLQLAPLGADLLRPNERRHTAAVQIDTSQLSVKEGVGNLLDASEYRQVPPEPELDFSDFVLAEVGADVLKPEERKPIAVKEVDTSGLSLGAMGENLAPAKPAAPPAPDVSGIELQK